MDGLDLPTTGDVFFLKRKKGGLEARAVSCFLGERVDHGRPGHGLRVDPYSVRPKINIIIKLNK